MLRITVWCLIEMCGLEQMELYLYSHYMLHGIDSDKFTWHVSISFSNILLRITGQIEE